MFFFKTARVLSSLRLPLRSRLIWTVPPRPPLLSAFNCLDQSVLIVIAMLRMPSETMNGTSYYATPMAVDQRATTTVAVPLVLSEQRPITDRIVHVDRPV